MKKNSPGVMAASRIGFRRRMALTAVYLSGAVALGAVFAATPGRGDSGGGGTTATRPATVSAANKSAAAAEFDKASDLYSQQKYAEAKAENDRALTLDPTNSGAMLLRRVLQSKLNATADTGTGAGNGVAAGKPGVLSPQQISLIRIMELSADEHTVRGTIDHKVLDDFWNDVVKKDRSANISDQARGDFERVDHLADQIQRIKQSGERKYMEKINLLSDPADMMAFKNSVHPYVLQSCATAACHGGDGGGNFRLVTPGPANGTPDQVLYTNFYIMNSYANKDGGQMIDRNNPDRSLFLQYGLQKNNATLAHPGPEVRKLGSVNDPRFRVMSDWVKSLALPQPNYGIAFEVPGAPPTAPPATAPGTQPK